MAMTRFFRPLALAWHSMVGLQFMAAAQDQAARPVKYATEYDWSMSPAEELGQAGRQDSQSRLLSSWSKGKRAGVLGPHQRVGARQGHRRNLRRRRPSRHAAVSEQARACRGRNSFERIRRTAGGTHRRALCAHQSSRHSAVRHSGGAAERIEGVRASFDSLFQPHRGFLRIDS